MSEMADMSRAIRTELQKHGRSLSEIPDEVLVDYTKIVLAFGFDLYNEAHERRKFVITGIDELREKMKNGS